MSKHRVGYWPAVWQIQLPAETLALGTIKLESFRFHWRDLKLIALATCERRGERIIMLVYSHDDQSQQVIRLANVHKTKPPACLRKRAGAKGAKA